MKCRGGFDQRGQRPFLSLCLVALTPFRAHALQATVTYKGEPGIQEGGDAPADAFTNFSGKVLTVEARRRTTGTGFLEFPELSQLISDFKHDFPTILKGANVSDVYSPFAKVRTRMVPVQPHNTFATAVDIEIATPEIIVSVYLLLFVPLAMSWAYFVHYGYKESHYLIMVPFTLCSFTVGLDLVNQSLSTLTAAPMALTAIQAGSTFVAMMLWTFGCQVYFLLFGKGKTESSVPVLERSIRSGERSPSRVPAEMALYPLSCGTQMRVLLKWTPAALGFVAYQLINHQVSMYCSLSERTVFLNLCPLFALFIEPLVLPSRVENVLNQTFASKMALVTMAFGAVLFSLQYRDFTANGLRSAGILVALMLPYRLLQRMLLADCQQVPASLLCAFDGLLLTIPAGTLTIVNERFFIEAYTVLLYNPSIMLMFGLSIFAFIGNHLAVLYLLKATSATSTMVFGNLSNFVVVFEGIVFFSDPVFQAPLVMTGIALSLLGGIWYAIDQTPSEEKGLGNRSPLTAESHSGSGSIEEDLRTPPRLVTPRRPSI